MVLVVGEWHNELVRVRVRWWFTLVLFCQWFSKLLAPMDKETKLNALLVVHWSFASLFFGKELLQWIDAKLC